MSAPFLNVNEGLSAEITAYKKLEAQREDLEARLAALNARISAGEKSLIPSSTRLEDRLDRLEVRRVEVKKNPNVKRYLNRHLGSNGVKPNKTARIHKPLSLENKEKQRIRIPQDLLNRIFPKNKFATPRKTRKASRRSTTRRRR